MQGFLVLSDAASTDAASGKINLLGAGWSVTGPAVPMSAVAGFLRVPWEKATRKIRFALRLLDEEGVPVRPFTDSDGPLVFSGEITPDPDHLEPIATRVPFNLSFAIPIPPLPLETGRVYEWVMEAEETRVASVHFAVRAEQPMNGAEKVSEMSSSAR
ncbi:hypothetical protein AB0M50_30855 [Nonomuraea fuscirosea]|uniref:DUF6941 family protein n=1 Tax=Nonomuraea fuscirosea TaxID=1291556 RepID=UPI002DDB4413|nr:hypothetical protein [Nonomuraea fuscirosea]WSA55851.1 hypothetical protein OIE67_14955 [Nonomuraea fuscirosea]